MSHTSAPTSVTTGNINQLIWRLTLPAMGAHASHVLFEILNAFWVSQAGSIAMAALTASSFFVWSLYSIALMVSTGTTAIIARRIGENNQAEARKTAQQALWLSALTGVGILLLALPLIAPMFQLMKTAPAVAVAGKPYLYLYTSSAFMMLGFLVVEAIFIGKGNTRTPMLLTLLALVINMVLDPLLILGWGPFPALGLLGAAIATITGRLVATLLGLWLLWQEGWLIWGWYRPQTELLTKIATIGWPTASGSLFFCVIYMVITRQITPYGMEPLAALGIGHRLESFVFTTMTGFAVACTTLVGQNLGAGLPERAEQIAWRACWITTLLNFGFSLMVWGGAPWVLTIFSIEPLVIMHGVDYLQIVACSLIFMGWLMVLEGVFAGAGNTWPPMIVTTVGTFIRLPLAWWLADYCGWGTVGIWWAITLSIVLKGSWLLGWFKQGHWKHKKI